MGKRFSVRLGDCREVLARLPADSVDAVVTDPPYGLSAEPDIAEVMRHWLAGDHYEHGSAGFMGKDWDSFVPGPEYWREVWRVLKPGGHALVFAGTRTQDLMTVALRFARFEIRDVVDWLYGSGFPKSLNVSKAIDKERVEDEGPTRVVCRAIRAAMDERGLTSGDLAPHFGGCHSRLIDHWAARDTDSQPNLPTWEQWCEIKMLIGISDDLDSEVRRLNDRKGNPGDSWQNADVVGEYDGEPGGFGDTRFSTRDNLIRELSDAAKQWDGWATALKPAREAIILARKPPVGTVAANVREHGTGALNIDACRIATDDPGSGRQYSNVGRWPANVVLDEEAAAMLDEQSGASRFFYVAKASRRERDKDAGEGGNKHPTVKPAALMRWLVRLIAPPDGLVLDPFAGSGSTGVACAAEGARFLGIELEIPSWGTARRRVAAAYASPTAEEGEPPAAEGGPVPGGDDQGPGGDQGVAV